MKIAFTIFLGLLLVVDLFMIAYPQMVHRWTERWFDWTNGIARRVGGWEIRIVDPARHMRFIRIYGIAFGLFLAGWLSFVMVKFH